MTVFFLIAKNELSRFLKGCSIPAEIITRQGAGIVASDEIEDLARPQSSDRRPSNHLTRLIRDDAQGATPHRPS